MSGKREKRVSTQGGESLKQANPFDGLPLGNLPEAKPSVVPNDTAKRGGREQPKRGRVEIRRVKAGRGGKTVTELRGFAAGEDLDGVLKRLKTQLGTGGTRREGHLELQGDVRDAVEAVCRDMGYRPVRTGG